MQTVLPFSARCYSSGYFSTGLINRKVSHIHRKCLTSVLKKKGGKVGIILQYFILRVPQSNSSLK